MTRQKTDGIHFGLSQTWI